MSKSATALSRYLLRKLPPVTLGLALLAAAATGCRSTTDNQIDLLERELRVQEDYIYELEDYIVEYSEKLRDCRSCYPQQPAVYAEEVYVPESTSESSTTPKRRRNGKEQSVLDKKKDELPSPNKNDRPDEILPENLDIPDDLELDIELDEPVGSLDDAQALQVAADGSIIIPDPVDFQDMQNGQGGMTVEEIIGEEPIDEEQLVEEIFADDEVESTAAMVERVAERLEVKQLFRGEGDQHSPQNLLTVVEALDANNEPVDLDGEVSLMVMAPKEGRPQRLKRWNFTPEETLEAWQSSELGDGLHLELPMEETELTAAPLELWVRLVTSDGRKLLTQLPFELNQLTDIASAETKPLPQGRSPVETDSQISTQPINALRTNSISKKKSQKLTLVESEQPADQPRWRASMHRTDRTAEGFATTSSKSNGWTRQAPGRQPYTPPQIASRPASTARQPVSQKRSQPVWNSGRVVPPSPPMSNPFPSGNTPASWSPSRY